MSKIHPTAIIYPGAELGSDVEIGPYCVVGGDVRLGNGTRLLAHVVLTGRTTLGEGNIVHSHAVLGGPPQDVKYKGEPTGLEIGDCNTIREMVTLNAGTVHDKLSGGRTRIGSKNMLMAGVHFGHDCRLGSGCIIANNCMIAGHVHIGDRAILLGGVGVHHFVSIGDYAFIAGGARIKHDIPPFVKVQEEGRIVSLNRVGLRRAGYPEAAVVELDAAVRRLVRQKRPMAVTIRSFARDNGLHPDVTKLLSFLERRSAVRNGRYLESLRAG